VFFFFFTAKNVYSGISSQKRGCWLIEKPTSLFLAFLLLMPNKEQLYKCRKFISYF